MKMKPNLPELLVDFENQPPCRGKAPLLEKRAELVEGIESFWYEYVPTCYTGETAVPLVLEMHGGRGDGLRDAEATDWRRLAEEENLIVVYPNARRLGRWECDELDMELLCRLLKRLCAAYRIDVTRIYMQGCSNGEMITTTFALCHPEWLAAAGFVCGPLPADMLLQKPSLPLPCIQLRGEKDVRFPYGSADETDIYRPKSMMNDLNRLMWKKQNGLQLIPQMLLHGKDNFFWYSGTQADLLYWEVKDMGHRYPVSTAHCFWELCYSRWARVDGQCVRLREEQPLEDVLPQFAFAVGGDGIYAGGEVRRFHSGQTPVCLVGKPTRREADPLFDVGEMLLTPSVYLSLEAFSAGMGGTFRIAPDGSEAFLLSPDGKEYHLEKNSSVVYEGKKICSLKKPRLYYYGSFYVPACELAQDALELYAAQTDDAVVISKVPCELTKGGARIISRLVNAPARYPEPLF